MGQPGFSWSDVTNASHYEIAVFAYGSNGTNISGTPLTAAYTPPSVLRPDWYYWRARAWDGTTAGVWSNDSWFKINIGAPNNVTPVTNDGTYNLTPTFDWSDVCGADGYDLYAVRYDETGTPQTAIYTGTTASEYTPPSNLTPGIYAWYVRAKSGHGIRPVEHLLLADPLHRGTQPANPGHQRSGHPVPGIQLDNVGRGNRV